MTGKLVHDYGVLGLVKCPGDMLNKETQYLLVLLGRHIRSSSDFDNLNYVTRDPTARRYLSL